MRLIGLPKWGPGVRALWRYRDAVYSLALLNLRGRYNNSFLGAAWSLVNPLFFMAVFTFVFTQLLPSETPNYPVFALSALLPWNYFQAALLGTTVSVTGARGLVTKLAFPRAILPLAAVLTEAVTFSLALGVVLIVLIVIGQGAGLALFALIPLVGILTVLALGLGMVLAALNVQLRDTQEFLNVFLFGWFFMTPIIYTLDRIPADRLLAGIPARLLIQVVNPLAPLVTAFRQVIYERRFPDWELILIGGVVAGVVFSVGVLIFGWRARTFAEAI